MLARALKYLTVVAATAVVMFPDAGLTSRAAAALSNPAAAATRAQEDERAVHPLDEFVGFLGECDLGARLDNFAIEMQNAPQSTGYIIIYTGKYSLPGRMSGYHARLRQYLVETRGIDANRLVIVDGGYRQEMTTTLWIVREGASPPEPTATIDVVKELDKAYKFDERQVYLNEDSEPITEDVEQVEYTTEETTEEPSEEPAVDEADAEQPVEDAIVSADALTEEEKAEEATVEPEEEAVDMELFWANELYAKALEVETKASGCIIFYADRASADFGRMQSIVERGKLRLVEKHGVKAERLTFIFGGYRESPAVELWIVPASASLPVPTPEPEKKTDEPEPQPTAQQPAAQLPSQP